jgi:TolB-like protein/Tfp pilus assembly protein PilF
MSADLVKFGEFELDTGAYELRLAGRSLKLERIPMELLRLLVENRGALVTRQTIIERLWGKDVFLDTDNGINIAVRKVRQALEQDPQNPQLVQTVPGKGYRFAADITPPPSLAPDLSLGTGPARSMLAVLPFDNLTGDLEQEYFSDGLTEETISYLGQINPQCMGVIARTSSMAYKHTSKSVRQIGRELGVDYILESSVRREGERVRITTQLIRVKDQTHLWASSYDRRSPGFLDIQVELGKAIAQGVQIKLAAPGSGVPRQHSQNPDAYDLYLRGRYYWNHLNPRNLSRAIEQFQAAVKEDPNYALAYSGLADSYSYLPLISDVRSQDYREKAKEAAEAAVGLNPNLSEGQTSMGIINFWLEWDWPSAEECFRRALELDGNNIAAHRVLSHVLSQTGRHEAAIFQMEMGRRLDPFSHVMQAISAQFFFQARRYEEAKEKARAAITLDDNFWVGHQMLAQALERLGEHEEALREADRAFKLSRNTLPFALKTYVLAQTGRREEARAAVQLMRENSRHQFVPAFNIALAYAGLGEEIAMFEFLEKACEERNVHVVFLTADPKWDVHRKNVRFQSLLQRAGIATA